MKVVKLTEKHLQLILSFDKMMVPLLPLGTYHHENMEFIKDCLLSGLSLGLFDRKRLIGYRLTFIPNQSDLNLGKLLDMKDAELAGVAQFYGTMLSPDFRGLGLGTKLVKESLKLISKRRLKYALVTVHPNNNSSLKMCLKCGFLIAKEITFYGGMPRLLLVKTLNS